MNITHDHFIGEGFGEGQTYKNLHLHFVPIPRRFMVSVRNKDDTSSVYNYHWGVFARDHEMDLHYLEHPLSRMGNQPLVYHWPGTEAQTLTVRRHQGSHTHLHFTIFNPRSPRGQPHIFLVSHEKLKHAVLAIRAELAQASRAQSQATTRPTLKLVQGGMAS